MRGEQFLKPLSWQTYPDDQRICLLTPNQSAVGYNLILSGQTSDLDALVQLADVPALLQPPLDRIYLSKLFENHAIESASGLKGFDEIEIRLYNLNSNTTEQEVWDLIKKIYTLAAEEGKVIFADPNFITNAPGGMGGGSGGTTGGPLDKIGRPGTDDDNIQHWAYTSDGIFLEDGNSARLVGDITGKNVPVFVFDTCDRRLEKEINQVPHEGDADFSPNKLDIWRNHPAQSLILNISSPSGRYHPQNEIRRPVRIVSSNDPAKDVDEHGFFVAGIIHRVAPDSSIHLVDVLNREGRGETYGLIKALHMLAERAVLDMDNTASLPLEGVVVNLSLGTSLSEGYMEAIKLQDLLKALRKTAYRAKHSNSHLLLSLLDDMVNYNYYVGSLRLIVKLLYELGAIMIAAAGNGSATVVGEQLKQIPASYPEIIAVAASTQKRMKANFSNLGDIMAPGGGKTTPDIQSKEFKYDTEPLEAYKKYSILSVVPKLTAEDTGYAFWRGTSFSAPFVSGLAALMVEKLRSLNKPIHPNHIRSLMLRYAREGIINVQTILGQIR